MINENKLIFRLALESDYEKIVKFYYEVIDELQNQTFSIMWVKNGHPSNKYIMDSIKSEEMVLLETKEKEVVGCSVVNHNFVEDFNKVKWQIKAEPKDIAILHTLAIGPKFRKTGASHTLIKEIINFCKERGYKTIRIDALKRNIPACKLYQRTGFTLVETTDLFYQEIGNNIFEMYEYVLL